MQYTLVGTEDGQVLSVFLPGRNPLIAHSTHPNFQRILGKVFGNDESVVDLFDIAQTASIRFKRLSDRVTAANGRLYLDGEEVANALATQVVRFLNEGVEDWKPLVNFFENVQSNPNEHSKEQLYTWLAQRDFTITDTGMIVGYKGVSKGENGEFRSISRGTAIVDGEVHNGQIPNRIGSIVEMPRGDVHHDPSTGCSHGLHVGTYEYANNFGRGALLEVHVNPRDVVSVPTDSSWAKMRVCRYVVVDTIDAPYSESIRHTGAYYDESDKEYCEDCGAEFDWSGWCECDDDDSDWVSDDGMTYSVVVSDPGRGNVLPGDRFEDRDTRKVVKGDTFVVASVEGGVARGKWQGSNQTRSIRVDRLLSRKYRRI